MGKHRHKSIHLTGDVEGDATGIRNTLVKRTNPTFEAEIAECEKRIGRRDDLYRLWVRLLGIIERKTGKLIIAPLPDKVCDATSKPPVESTIEVKNSHIPFFKPSF